MQNSGPWDPWLPVVKNSQLFAKRAEARCRMGQDVCRRQEMLVPCLSNPIALLKGSVRPAHYFSNDFPKLSP